MCFPPEDQNIRLIINQTDHWDQGSQEKQEDGEWLWRLIVKLATCGGKVRLIEIIWVCVKLHVFILFQNISI